MKITVYIVQVRNLSHSCLFFFWMGEGSDQYLVLHSVLHRELFSMLCGDLNEKEMPKGREYMYTYDGFILV